MAEIMLKSIQLPGSADVYKIPEPVEIDESLSITGAAADAAAVGTALANTFTYGGVYNGDYNEAELGIWWSQPGKADSGCSNYPEGATYGFLTTSKLKNYDIECQTFAQYPDGKTWLRYYVSNSWSDWFRQDGLPGTFSILEPELVVVKDEEGNVVKNEDGSTKINVIYTNLNEYRGPSKAGLYLCARDRANTPFSEKAFDNFFILEVYCNFQRATDPKTGEIKFRQYNDTAGWSDWEEFNVRKKLSNIIVNGANQAPHKTYEVLLTYLANKDRLYYPGKPGEEPGFVSYEYVEETGEFKPKTITGEYGGYNEKGEPINPKFPIVCATITMLALQGVGFENCRINTGKIEKAFKEWEDEEGGVHIDEIPQLIGGENIPYAGCKTIDLTEKEIIDYWDISKGLKTSEDGKKYLEVTHPHGIIYAANMAKLFYDAGLLHKIKTSPQTEILPGDVLFYANYAGGNTYTPFLSIGHVEIFLGWDGDRILSLGTVNGTDTPTIAYSHHGSNQNFTKTLKYYARIPCAGEPGAIRQISEPLSSDSRTISNGSSLKISLTEPLKIDRAYPITIKTTGRPTGSEPYFTIYGENDAGEKRQLSYIKIDTNKGQNTAPNTYYTTLISSRDLLTKAEIDAGVAPMDNITTLYIYCRATFDGEVKGATVTLDSVSVYNTIVPQG